jgi:uncharacterized protein (DUF433 family)
MVRYMANPLSVRIPEATIARLAARAERSEIPPRTLAQRYIEEGLRRDEHPAIHFVDGPAGRRASLVGTGLDVWEVVAVVRDNGGDVGAAAEYLERPAPLIQAAVSYYAAYRDEVDRWIALNEQEAEHAFAAWEAGRRAFDR